MTSAEPPQGRPRRRICLVDDHALVREGLRRLIDQESDLCVASEAASASEALETILRAPVDAVVVDLSLRGESGLELVKRLRDLQPAPKVLVLSMHDESVYAERAIRAGALGYVMKRESSGKVIEALRRVLEGRLFVSPAVAALAAEKFLRQSPLSPESAVERLSDRELEIFRRIGHGEENRRIATDLRLSLKTVQTHCAHIKEKLGLENATELVREAVKWVENEP